MADRENPDQRKSKHPKSLNDTILKLNAALKCCQNAGNSKKKSENAQSNVAKKQNLMPQNTLTNPTDKFEELSDLRESIFDSYVDLTVLEQMSSNEVKEVNEDEKEKKENKEEKEEKEGKKDEDEETKKDDNEKEEVVIKKEEKEEEVEEEVLIKKEKEEEEATSSSSFSFSATEEEREDEEEKSEEEISECLRDGSKIKLVPEGEEFNILVKYFPFPPKENDSNEKPSVKK